MVGAGFKPAPYSALTNAGNERQKQELLPRLARGQVMFAISITEPDGGTDVLNVVKTTAHADGDHFVINGAKVWTTCAHLADYMVVYARTDPHAAKKTQGITTFLVDPKTPGIEIRKINKLGIRATSSFEVFYNDVRVPRYWRDARLYRIAPITDEMVLNFIGERLGLPRSF